MRSSVPAPVTARSGSNSESVLITGTVFPALAGLLLATVLAPFQIATAITAVLGAWMSLVAIAFPVRGRRAAMHWRRVPVHAVDARIGTEAVVSDCRPGERYFLEVAYEYTFDGRRYRGHCYHLDAALDSSWDLNRIQESMHTAAAATQVFVNPSAPGESCLCLEQAGEELGRYFAVFLIGLILAVLGAASLVYG